jgi:hypothetical protein
MVSLTSSFFTFSLTHLSPNASLSFVILRHPRHSLTSKLLHLSFPLVGVLSTGIQRSHPLLIQQVFFNVASVWSLHTFWLSNVPVSILPRSPTHNLFLGREQVCISFAFLQTLKLGIQKFRKPGQLLEARNRCWFHVLECPQLYAK